MCPRSDGFESRCRYHISPVFTGFFLGGLGLSTQLLPKADSHARVTPLCWLKLSIVCLWPNVDFDLTL